MDEIKVPYWKTEKGKEAAKKYSQSEKGKAALKRYQEKKREIKVAEAPVV